MGVEKRRYWLIAGVLLCKSPHPFRGVPYGDVSLRSNRPGRSLHVLDEPRIAVYFAPAKRPARPPFDSRGL
jgi:hypothetical protein